MIVATAGHIDHGKTALVRALTGVDTDRLKEEKLRGISIDLGFAYLPAPDGSILGFVDVPGHEQFVHNMLAGATGVDFVLLVVAADDGVMPQTREHVAIIDLLGVERGLVALTKVDKVPAPQRAEAGEAIRQLLSLTKLVSADVLPVSCVTGEGIDTLRDRLFDAARSTRARSARGRFRLAVDRCFSLAGAGTVVTGTVLSGSVLIGDKVTVSPSGLPARVRSIHSQNRPAERGVAGERCALNLTGEGVSKNAIARGDVVVDPDLHAPSDRIDATFKLLASERKPVLQWMPARLHHAVADVGARILLLGNEIGSGEEGLIQLVLDRPIAAAAGDHFVLRDTTAQRTIGGGKFTDLRAPSRKRRTPERLAQLAAYAIADAEAALPALLDRPPYCIDLTALARDRAMRDADIEDIISRLEVHKLTTPSATFALSGARWLQFQHDLLTALKTYHAAHPDFPGVSFQSLRFQLQPRLPELAFVSALKGFARSGEIGLDGAWVHLSSHAVQLTAGDESLWARIEPLLGNKERFQPPRVRDIAKRCAVRDADVRRLLKILGRMGKVYEIAPDHFFPRSTVAEMVDFVVELAGNAMDGQFAAAQFRDRAGNGRKVAIQVLEFYDRQGITVRHGDLRRVNKNRLARFRLSIAEANGTEPSLSGREASPVGRPDFKSGKGREPVLGGFELPLSSATFKSMAPRPFVSGRIEPRLTSFPGQQINRPVAPAKSAH